MRRAIVALLGTAAGTTLLVGSKAGLLEKPTPRAETQTVDSGTPSARDVAAGPEPATATATSPTAGGPSAGPDRVIEDGPAAGGAKPGSSGPAGPAGLHDGTFTGARVTVKYGDVQVQITVTSGRLTDVTPLQLPSADAHSVQINQRAAPVLRQEALTAQSAVIQAVSGATYTSKGYLTSLQAALDAAKGG
jgi:uncharacterized protein with FMN-binding domain